MPSLNLNKDGWTSNHDSEYIHCDSSPHPATADYYDLPYFHPDVANSDKIREILRDRKEGSFIIRRSTGEEAKLTISVMHKEGRLIHLRIDCSDQMYAIGDKKFKDLPTLIKCFQTNPIVNAEKIPDVFLKTAVCRSNSNRDNVFYPEINPVTDEVSPGGQMINSCLYANDKSGKRPETLFPPFNYQMKNSIHYAGSERSSYGCCLRDKSTSSTINDTGYNCRVCSDGNVKLAHHVDLPNGWKVINVPGQPLEYQSPPSRQVFTNLPEDVKGAMSPEIHSLINSFSSLNSSGNAASKSPTTSIYLDMNKSLKGFKKIP